MNDFKQKLIGTYHNQQQAYNNPVLWAHIYVSFEEQDDGIFSKSWYAIEHPDNPYRRSLLKLREENNQIIVTSINLVTNTESCEISFERIGEHWVGYNQKCIIPDRNQYISTSVRFDGTNYFSRDAGYDLGTNQFLWGKEDGEFHFIKV